MFFNFMFYAIDSQILYGDSPQSQKPNWNSIKFMRASSIFKNQKIKIFEGMITPDDILQGALGDCYFLSSLAALSEFPKLIERLINTKAYNTQGFYSVTLIYYN